MISVYGASGFIGSRFCNLYPNLIVKQDRNERKPRTKDILYFISTTDNYNIHTNITLDVETNLKVLCEVLDYCRDSEITFNFISSWFVYGETNLPAKEEYNCSPNGFYSITKKAAEDLLISFCKTYNVKYRIIRLCNVLGTGDKNTSSKKNAISYMIDLLKKNEDVYLCDSGTLTRDIMHVIDVCKAIKLICDNGTINEIYNVGSGQPIQIGDIIWTAKKYLNSSSQIKFKDFPTSQVKNFWMDIGKLKNLGFTQTISTEEIIKELCTN